MFQEMDCKLMSKLPQQRNFYDCGLFMLKYIERWASVMPQFDKKRLRWDAFSELSFDQEHISAMRQSMRDDIEKLGQEQMKLAHCAAVATAAERRRSKAVSSQCVE